MYILLIFKVFFRLAEVVSIRNCCFVGQPTVSSTPSNYAALANIFLLRRLWGDLVGSDPAEMIYAQLDWGDLCNPYHFRKLRCWFGVEFSSTSNVALLDLLKDVLKVLRVVFREIQCSSGKTFEHKIRMFNALALMRRLRRSAR